MLEQISIGVTVTGVIIGAVGYKSKKAVAIGSLLFALGLLGIFFFTGK